MSKELKNINEEKIFNPPHYKTGIQPLDYIQANKLDFLEGNIIKYLTRYKNKNGVEDLIKAKKYLDLIIERERKRA
tara:strand:- start:347 stop:574 length:228 start_codon:yes stop_codon:yes gene_type:complete